MGDLDHIRGVYSLSGITSRGLEMADVYRNIQFEMV